MTTREYKDLPKDIQVATAFGPVAFNPTGDDHVYIRADKAGLRVNGVEYSVAFHASKKTDGTWGEADHVGLYATRMGGSFEDPSPSARKKLTAELSRVATEWAASDQGKLALAVAGWRALENAALAREGELEDLIKQVSAKQSELLKLNSNARLARIACIKLYGETAPSDRSEATEA